MAREFSEVQNARTDRPGAKGLRAFLFGPQATELRFAVIATCAGIAILAVGTVARWPGPRSDCEGNFCYCEAPRGGVIAQPANTLSNLAPVGMAFITAAQMANARRRRRVKLPAIDLLGCLFAIALVYQGIGSMAFHASLTITAGVLDVTSMFSAAGLMIVTNLHRMRVLQPRHFLPCWLAVMIPGAIFARFIGAACAPGMGALFAGVLITEILASRREKRHDALRFRIGISAFVVGVTLWTLSLAPGFTLCAPNSLLQPHAFWHLAAALTTALFAAHARINLERSHTPALVPATAHA
jgi:hypothetical protein